MRTQIKFCWLLFFLFFSFTLNAQTEKGRFIYGGSIYATTTATSSNYVNLGIQPQFGGFPVKNLAIVGLLHFTIGYNPTMLTSYGITVGAGPELRYYAGGEKVKFVVHGNVIPLLSSNVFALQGGGGPGVAIFPNSNISINTSMYVGAFKPTFDHFSPAAVLISFNTVINGLFGGKPTTTTLGN